VAGDTAAFYAVADARHFVGLAALVDSLRLVGHAEPIYVADCGLTGGQRRRIEQHATLVDAPPSTAPHLAKTAAPLAHPADVMVLIDADVIVTRPLTPLLERAREGKLVVVADTIDRFDERWSEILGVREVARRPYVNSGLVVTGRAAGERLFERLRAGGEHVDLERTYIRNGSSDDPFFFLDQDVLNGIVAGLPDDEVEILEHRLAPFPPFSGLEVDEATLRCSYADGVEAFALHHILHKPWLAPTRWGAYSRLLVRLLLADDVVLRLEPHELPLRLRPGPVGWLEKRRSHLLAVAASSRGRLGLRRALDRWLKGDKGASVSLDQATVTPTE
jgi:hypothetical protein